jgi:hypothetical protein
MFEDIKRFQDERYSAFSSLIRGTFDEALRHFSDQTVDLLHIDGLNTYEAVRHTFESWKSKLSDRAVVLFHNINVRGGDFGVWQLWAELCEQFPSFEFLHGDGLGVLAFGDDRQPAIVALCSRMDSASVATVRNRFAVMGGRWLNDARERALARRVDAVTTEREQARAAVRALEARVRESVHSREQVLLRIDTARRDVYNANLRAEHAEARVEQAELRAEQARIEREHVAQERDALLSSTAWKVTWPLRVLFKSIPSGLRRTLRASVKRGGAR